VSVQYGIVLGAPRSGTTFLTEVLDTLPAVECVSGNLLPVAFAHLAAQPLPAEVPPILARGLRGAFADYLSGSPYRSRSSALRKWWLIGAPPLALPRALRSIRAETSLVYKEPFLGFSPDLAYNVSEHARLIFIYRDGRDVADSLVRSFDVLSDARLANLDSNEAPIGRAVGELYVPWWVPEGQEGRFLAASPYVRAIWMWREMVARSRQFFADPEVSSSGRVLHVRYEQLVSEPIEQGHRIAEHLGQSPTRRTERRLRAAHPRSIGGHRRRPPAEIAAAEQVAGDQLRALGYHLTTPAHA